MSQTKAAAKSGAISSRIKIMEAKQDSLLNRVIQLAELSDDLAQPESKHLFAMRSRTLEATQSDYARVVDELVAARSELDPDCTPSYDALQKMDELVCLIMQRQAELSEGAAERKQPTKSNQPSSRITLPQITLPRFNGTVEAWKPFSEVFQRLVGSNENLTNTDRLNYLLSQLAGPALAAIAGISPSGENYNLIWKILTEKYDDVRVIANTYLGKLLRFKPLAAQDDKNLERFCSEFEASVLALRSLNILDLADFIFTHLALSRLDTKTVNDFEQANGADIPTFKSLTDFIHVRHKTLSRASSISTRTNTTEVAINRKSPRTLTIYTKTPPARCEFCHEKHTIYTCSKFKLLNPSERNAAVIKQKLCSNCLRKHNVAACESKGRCGACRRRHHSLLHGCEEHSCPAITNETTSTQRLACNTNYYPQTERAVNNFGTDGLTPTAKLIMDDGTKSNLIIRALIDSGATHNLISLDYCLKNRLRINYAPSSIYGLGNHPHDVTGFTYLRILSRFDARNSFRVKALIVRSLTYQLPALNLCENNLAQLEELSLADDEFDKGLPIEFILGAGLIPRILGSRKLRLAKSNLYAVDSAFGYLIMGEINEARSIQRALCLRTGHKKLELESLVQSFWELEAVPNRRHMSPEEKACEEDFELNVCRTETGGFMVALPFKLDSAVLGNSRSAAERRLAILERRLDACPALRAGYNDTFTEYLKRGFLNVVRDEAKLASTYYIPHRAVYNPDKTTSKIRIVLDASSKSSSGKSLNDVLHVGPNLQSNIFNLLTNFRLFEVALSADIEKMYFSIKVHPRHRSFLRVLYRFSKDEPVGTYEFSSLPMGLSCSSYLSVRVLRRLFREEDNPGLRQLMESSTCTYMDDYLLSVPTSEEASIVRRLLTESHAKAGFVLTKWISNCPRFMQELGESIETNHSINLEADSHVKLVGLWWSPALDEFAFKIGATPNITVCTKRSILSATASLYDPLGFLSPVTAGCKLLIQECWKRDLGWDQAVPEDLATAWKTIQSELPMLTNLRIPRHLGLAAGSTLSLMCFADASEKCLGAVIYARVGGLNESAASVSLLCTKSRLASLKKITMARLELCAAHLLASLAHAVVEEIQARQAVHELIAFTDSTVALAWIQASPHRWQTFVANRTSAIQEMVPPGKWRHIAGDCNPSDVITRPPTPSAFLALPEWVSGPAWAYLPCDQWPCKSVAPCEPGESLPEFKKSVLAVHSSVNDHPIDLLIERCSSLPRLLNATVFMLRFAKKLISKNSITTADLDAATTYLVKSVQARHFSADIDALGRGLTPSKRVRKLAPFICNGIVLVGGRLRNAELSLRQRHPILLPAKDKLTELIISHYHLQNLHAGPGLLLALLRSEYWILSARAAVRRITHACNVCFRLRPKPSQPIMGDLPDYRVKSGKPFFHVGVDYAGPVAVMMNRGRGCRSTKAYFCLFVCLATKAVHIELVSDLSTNLFISAFKRFLSRRGPVALVLSDGGRNFLGAKRRLGEMHALTASEDFEKEVIRELTPLKTEFRTNPPFAPNFGGIWEANIKSFKTHLYRVMGTQRLTYEELNTLVIQIEALLNSRPLCVLSSDPSEPVALTPAHFLNIQPLRGFPAPNVLEVPLSRLPRYALVDQMIQSYWKRWRVEYLSSLQVREKWNTSDNPLRVGQVVLLNEPNTPTLYWPMGIVERIYPGPDGVTRVVGVKTRNGSYVRPASRICVLPTQ